MDMESELRRLIQATARGELNEADALAKLQTILTQPRAGWQQPYETRSE